MNNIISMSGSRERIKGENEKALFAEELKTMMTLSIYSDEIRKAYLDVIGKENINLQEFLESNLLTWVHPQRKAFMHDSLCHFRNTESKGEREYYKNKILEEIAREAQLLTASGRKDQVPEVFQEFSHKFYEGSS